MRILHLVTDGRLMKTIHLASGVTPQQTQANRDAINRLVEEATAPSEIIICDVGNMEIGNIEVPENPHIKSKQVNYDKIVMLTFIVVVTIGYMLVN